MWLLQNLPIRELRTFVRVSVRVFERVFVSVRKCEVFKRYLSGVSK